VPIIVPQIMHGNFNLITLLRRSYIYTSDRIFYKQLIAATSTGHEYEVLSIKYKVRNVYGSGVSVTPINKIIVSDKR